MARTVVIYPGITATRASVVECVWQALARHRCRLPDGVLWTQLTLPALDSGVADAGWPRHLCRTHSTTLPRQLSAMIVQSLTAQFTPLASFPLASLWAF